MNFEVEMIAIIGLGYVGLPLAVEFGKNMPTIGYDISNKRISELGEGHDATFEVDEEDFADSRHLQFTNHLSDLRDANVFIVTVPTPINEQKQPDLTPLLMASESIGAIIKKGDIVIYESTVYPGATEEQCIPVIEKISGLRYNEDFFAGYSPERINPGDKQHRLTTIKKITSGSTPDVAEFIDKLYGKIIEAGTAKVSSIKVAEAAKVIENTQRDLNIALINELAIIFNHLEIDTDEVLQAAGTKWNFLPFRPGLVGGHCIGVDPYYLTHKAQSLGYHPEVILAGRRINDGMGKYVVSRLIKAMIMKQIRMENARILLLGLTFKENCPDLRNTRVIDVIEELKQYGIQTDVFDPWASITEAQEEYGIVPITQLQQGQYDAIVLTVTHEQFREIGAEQIRALGKERHVFFDLKSVYSAEESDLRL